MYKTKSGFTIVELLIVIVVIAILAAITIVAYNGFQTRAENIKTLNAVNVYVKAIKSYVSLRGEYPSDTAWPCLGPSGTTCARRTSNTCTISTDGGSAATVSFNTQISEVISGDLPSLSSQIVSCEGAEYKGGYFRGVTGRDASIAYYLKGSQPCDGLTGFQTVNRSQVGDATRCQVVFSTLP